MESLSHPSSGAFRRTLVVATNFVVAVTNSGTTHVTNQYYPTLFTGNASLSALTVNIAASAI